MLVHTRKADKEEVISDFQQTQSYQQTATKFGLSRQRVHQLVTGYKTLDPGKGDYGFIKQLKQLGEDCISCGNKRQAYHHLDGNSHHNVIENIIPVCRKCHGVLHSGIIRQPDVIKICQGWCGRQIGLRLGRGLQNNQGYCNTCYIARKEGRVPVVVINRLNRPDHCIGCNRSWKEAKYSRRNLCRRCFARSRYADPVEKERIKMANRKSRLKYLEERRAKSREYYYSHKKIQADIDLV